MDASVAETIWLRSLLLARRVSQFGRSQRYYRLRIGQTQSLELPHY